MPPAGPMYLELSFQPSIELISVVRRFVASVHQRLKVSKDLTARVALATHELLENATKYSTNGSTRLRIEVLREGEHDRVRICTWNHTLPHHRENLKAGLDEMQGAADPFAHYQTLMVRTSKRDDGSGLGLARIRVEAEMDVSYELGDDGLICIVAQTNP